MCAVNRHMLVESGPSRFGELHRPVTLVADRTEPPRGTDRSRAGKHGNSRHAETAVRPPIWNRMHQQLARASEHTLTCRMGEQAARCLTAVER